MAETVLESSAVSAFCESAAIMLAAGIQTDEAVSLLGDNMAGGPFKRACDAVYARLIGGDSLAVAMERSGAFPRHVVDMVGVGEVSGRLEPTLRTLAVYYDEEGRLFSKMRSSVVYPAALLCVMSVILAFTVAVILPVFVDVYESLAGGLVAGSFNAVSAAIGIGWAALAITLACTVAVLAAAVAMRSEGGRRGLMSLAEKLPFTRSTMYQLALSRFTSALATYVASGIDTDTAMKEAVAMVDHRALRAKLEAARGTMLDVAAPKSLAQAISEGDVFEPVYARMLTIGARSGSTEDVLGRLSLTFFDDAIVRMDRLVDGVEPVLAAFLTVAVGATLVSVMLPLIGIMGSIG
ncbi:type II secretion system F family protein [Arabiibacter massiliensis]|uniref:type II secretion system F family protein n=1 Tax=Arabiibacter massiliensis TaxID=1870985 RepID=UPI0009BADDD0|nr:type II secretion system F family protein [Arabiibacter massiliensis]